MYFRCKGIKSTEFLFACKCGKGLARGICWVSGAICCVDLVSRQPGYPLIIYGRPKIWYWIHMDGSSLFSVCWLHFVHSNWKLSCKGITYTFRAQTDWMLFAGQYLNRPIVCIDLLSRPSIQKAWSLRLINCLFSEGFISRPLISWQTRPYDSCNLIWTQRWMFVGVLNQSLRLEKTCIFY